jgi:DNA polymerase-3 subunit epsilon
MAMSGILWSEIPLHVIDFEGGPRTGVVEHGVVTLLGGEVRSTSTGLHAPLAPVPAVDTQCHGLSDRDLRSESPFSGEWSRWSELRRTGLFAAHNASVESGLLRATWARPPASPAFVAPEAVAEWGPWIDTCRLARLWMPSLGDYRLSALIAVLRLGDRLESLSAVHCPPARRRHHCALYDALAAALVLRALCSIEGRSASTLAQLVRDGLPAAAAGEMHQGELDL